MIKQLKEQFNSKDCLLFETFNNEIFDNDLTTDCIVGKTFLRLNENSEINVNKIQLPKHSQLLIYCECDNDIDIEVKENIINLNEYFRHSSKELSFKINCKQKTNIYSIAILIK